MIALDAHAVRDLLHRDRRGPGQDTGEHALVARIEMLDKDKGQSGLRGNG